MPPVIHQIGKPFFYYNPFQKYAPNDIACGNEVNSPLGGEIPVSANPVITTTDATFSSIAATAIHNYTAVFIGAKDSVLAKVRR